jgi:hypothetical protein
MSENHGTEKRGRGRPEVDSEPLTVRLTADLMAAIDEARRQTPKIPTRPEMVRIAVADRAKRNGFLK